MGMSKQLISAQKWVFICVELVRNKETKEIKDLVSNITDHQGWFTVAKGINIEISGSSRGYQSRMESSYAFKI